MKYPKSKKQAFCDTYGDNSVMDDYAWLTDANTEESQEWIASQHAYTDAYFQEITYFEALKNYYRNKKDEENIISIQKQYDRYIGVYDSAKDGLTAFTSDLDFQEIEVLKKAGKPYTSVFSAEFSPSNPNLFLFTGYYEDETRISVNVAHYPSGEIISRFGFGFDYLWSKDGAYVYYSRAVVDPKNSSQSVQEIWRYNVNEDK